jgi:predicted glycoside hydrolase/deacetylase ChbG (UPF0249 family)
MVHMSDSPRAAEMALAKDRAVGLHLNLTQLFEDRPAAPAVRERQAAVCRHFADLRRRRWSLDRRPRTKRLIYDAINDQLDAFRLLYGREPTHLDSHHHVHVCPDVFMSSALASISKVRQTISPPPDSGARDRFRPGTLARRSRHFALRRRFITTDRFWFGPDLIPELGGAGIAEAVTEAASRPVEIMVHPSFDAELDVLLTGSWRTALAGSPLGSFRDLSARPRETPPTLMEPSAEPGHRA